MRLVFKRAFMPKPFKIGAIGREMNQLAFLTMMAMGVPTSSVGSLLLPVAVVQELVAEQTTDIIVMNRITIAAGAALAFGNGSPSIAAVHFQTDLQSNTKFAHFLNSTLSDERRIYVATFDSSPHFVSLVQRIEDFLCNNERFRTCTFFVLLRAGNGTDDLDFDIQTASQSLNLTLAANIYVESSSGGGDWSEIYGIHGHGVVYVERANAGSRLHQMLFKTSRRANFRGEKVVTLTDEPPKRADGALKPGEDETHAVLVYAMSYLQDALNMRIQLRYSPRGPSPGPNGTLIGSAIELNTGIGHIDARGLAFVAYRTQGPDGLAYLPPLDIFKMVVYFTQPKRTSSVNVFVHPFHQDTWICIIVTWLLLMLFLLAMSANVEMDRGEIPMWAAASISLQGWYRSQPQSISADVTLLTASLTALTCYTAYNAVLVSFFAIQNNPVRNFDDIISFGYSLATESKTPYTTLAMKAVEEDKKVHLDYTQMNGTLPETTSAIFKSKVALVSVPQLFSEDVKQFYLNGFVCDHISQVGIPGFAPRLSGNVVRKWSPLREYFSYKLTTAHERGIINIARRRRRVKAELRCYSGFKFLSTTLEMSDVFAAFMLLVGFGFSASLLVLVCERGRFQSSGVARVHGVPRQWLSM